MISGTEGLPVDPPIAADGTSLSRVHMVGIGGAGMSAIARILADRGLPVSGSDAKGSHVLTGLAQRGVLTAVGHTGDNLDLLPGGPTAVVVSTAIRLTNPEVVEARRRGIPVLQRAIALAALMTDHRSVCVAGTHGKTSTTSMLTVALQAAGLDPSFAIGGELNESGSGAHHGTGDIFVAESDESDGSFLAFAPHGAIITNLEADHLDHHGTAEAYAAVFRQFVDRIMPGGFLVLCLDDPGTRTLMSEVAGQPGSPRIVTYGFTDGADLRITDHRPAGHGGTAVVQVAGEVDVLLHLAVPGAHMLSNAVAALAAGIALGVSADTMAAGLAAYTGVRRRFEYKGRSCGVSVYDDYAHHPTEVAAQLLAARSVLAGTADSGWTPEPHEAGRLVVIFQPHLYSRTVAFAAQFATALSAADVVVVLDVYGAREDPVPGVSGELITRQIPDGPVTDGADSRQVLYLPSLAAVPETVGNLVRPGDLVITMGAGDVTMLGPQLLEHLESR
ncbi:UDP-N-acetylmuramate--alanine ligase [Nakamurella sp. UYEF19]|uniref:UDP-N-acetylmuramate--L-alanine ligase n=1 Tax=Nakamurella sp. UYEF19 TaxID=1756392 RepID=UPI0033944BA2